MISFEYLEEKIKQSELVIEAIEAVHSSKQSRGSLQAHIDAIQILEKRLKEYRERYPN